MQFYEEFRRVPSEACKEITAGKLKGFTDINPMWRIKKLTETFGPCGFGWYIESENNWSETHGNEIAAFCKVALRVKHPHTNEWSAPIIGIGGSKLAGKGKGDGIDDEAYKMAFTDAISIACKNLGMAADIYYAKDRTKYDTQAETSSAAPAAAKQKQQFDSTHPKWQEALDKMVAGQGSIAALQKTFIISANVEEQIKEYLRQHEKKA
jgi:hypothetical protein